MMYENTELITFDDCWQLPGERDHLPGTLLYPQALVLCLPSVGTECIFAESKWVHEDDIKIKSQG